MFSSSRNAFVGSLFIGLALLGAGCEETVSSENIRTAGISMATRVTAGTASSKVHVTLLVGGNESNTKVELMAGDELVAIADGDEKTMERVSAGEYEASFDIVDEDTEFAVHLLRDDDEDATGNGGELPAPFMITSDLGDEPISRMEDIEVTWSPSGTDDNMRLQAEDESGDGCITATEDIDVISDEGTYLIRAEREHFGDDEEETCDITLTVVREREGEIDGNLDRESTFFLHQVRSTTFLSAP